MNTINTLRNACALHLNREQVARANGDMAAARSARRQYEFNRDLLLQAYEERPPGVGAGRPLMWKLTIKSSLTWTGGDSNAAHHIPRAHGAAPATTPAIP